MSTCPQGHQSDSADYCDTCGSPIDSVAAAVTETKKPPAKTTIPCPNCHAANVPEALFCETCGYDFTTGTMPRPLTGPIAAYFPAPVQKSDKPAGSDKAGSASTESKSNPSAPRRDSGDAGDSGDGVSVSWVMSTDSGGAAPATAPKTAAEESTPPSAPAADEAVAGVTESASPTEADAALTVAAASPTPADSTAEPATANPATAEPTQPSTTPPAPVKTSAPRPGSASSGPLSPAREQAVGGRNGSQITGSPTAEADLALPDSAAEAAVAPDLTPIADSGKTWVAELWIDPDWYAKQQPPDPMPSPGLPQVVELPASGALIGRYSRSREIKPDLDCSSDPGTSRRHAQLSTDGRRWWIQDLDSANGTYVAGATDPLPDNPIAVGPRRELSPDDRIYVGAWTRVVVREAADGEL